MKSQLYEGAQLGMGETRRLERALELLGPGHHPHGVRQASDGSSGPACLLSGKFTFTKYQLYDKLTDISGGRRSVNIGILGTGMGTPQIGSAADRECCHLMGASVIWLQKHRSRCQHKHRSLRSHLPPPANPSASKTIKRSCDVKQTIYKRCHR